MSETLQDRRRRKFAAGVSDQVAGGLSAYSAGVFTTGFVASVLATLLGLARAPLDALLPLVAASFLATVALLGVAAFIKERSKRVEDDASLGMSDADLAGPEEDDEDV